MLLTRVEFAAFFHIGYHWRLTRISIAPPDFHRDSPDAARQAARQAATVFPYTISFIVPALNEEKVVETVIEQLLDQVRGWFADFELILVDDGSTDATGTIMDRLAQRYERVRVIHNGANLGFGASFQAGLKQARFDYVMLLCGDGGLPAKSLPPIFEKIGSADIVVPWMVNLRQIKTPLRYFLSRAYTMLLNSLSGLKLKYYNGLPVHRRENLEKIAITSGGFGFQAEVLVKLIRSGSSFVEVGVHGAEKTNRSSALRMRNWISVARTFHHLVREIRGSPRPSRAPGAADASGATVNGLSPRNEAGAERPE